MLGLFFAHPKSRQWTLDFFPFAIFGILYDFLRIFPKEWAGAIQIAGPYQIEVDIFSYLGFERGFIPTDFFIQHNHPIMDFVAGLVYGAHVIIPIGFAFYLWWRKSPSFNVFRWGFFFMNLAAFATYIAYPAAPPWYVTDYGLQNLGWDVQSSAAGLIRFDSLLGIEHFQNTYGRSAWIFGAIPSMHAGFPLFMSLFARKLLGGFRWFYYIFTVLAAFSAVYLNHHYFIDVLAGWIYAVAFYAVFSPCLSKDMVKSPIECSCDPVTE
jgi:membrane-associated phospholipid phosphatase